MRSFSATALALLGLADLTSAFTNGTLIPAYFCSPANDGMPKALGQLIPLLQKDQGAPLAFNGNAAQNLMTVPMTNSSKPGNAGYIIASFHNSINTITAIQQGIKVTLATGTSMTAGKPNLLILDSGDVNVALDGAMIWALNSTGARAGSFSDTGKVFVNFPGCGTNMAGQIAGVVHSQIISENNNYTTLSYTPDMCGDGKVTLKGLDVTDNGFGVWNYTFPVTGQQPFSAACLTNKAVGTTLKPTTTKMTTKPTAAIEEIVEILIIDKEKK